MRVLRATAMALLLLLTPAAAEVAVPPGFAPDPSPAPAPESAFLDGDGNRVGLGDFQGKVVLLNLWATWCPPCVSEMPSLDRLQARLGGEDFQVVAVSEDTGGRAVVAPFFARHGLDHLSVYLDPDAALPGLWGSSGLPTSILIDREGRVLGRMEGAADWDSPAALSLIRHVLGQSKEPMERARGVINTSWEPAARRARHGQPGL